MTTPAQTLRAAADKLRVLVYGVHADITANPYWGSDEHPPHDYPNLYARGVDNGLGGPAGAYAAALHPAVGYALADWFESAADDAEQIGPDPNALAVAGALLGEEAQR